MSRNTKIALIIVGALVVICLGVCGIGWFMLNRVSQQFLSPDPQAAKRVASEIVDYTLPDGYSELMGVDFLVYKMAVIAPTQRASDGMVFMLMQTGAGGMDQAEMERQMQQAFQQQFNRSGGTTHVVGQERVNIRGRETTLTIAENDTSPPMRQAVGTFEGKNGGMVVLMVMANADDWNDELMREFLGSFR